MRNLLGRHAAPLLISMVGLLGCDRGPSPSGDKPAPTPPASASPSAVAPSSLPSAQVPDGKTEPTAAPSASAAAGDEAAASLTGNWESSFQAKRGEVEMPPKVPDKVRKGDDGKTATGPGTMKLSISPAGDVKGRIEGALGPADISGKAEGDKVRAQLYPDDPLAKNAMFGIFHGERTKDDIVGQIRVANGDASVVREADVTLKKK